MSDITGIGLMGSPTTDSVLSSKEKLYFQKMFDSTATGDGSLSPTQQQAVAQARPHIGSKLDIKI
jgi:hypothetical protein